MNEQNALQVQTQTVAVTDESRATLDRLLVVRDTLAPDLTPQELQLFAMVSVRSGLDPFAKQIYAVKRKGRMTIQTGIDGYRSIAARTGEYDGQDEPVYGPDCPCGKGPRHPESSTVRVYRKGMSRAVAATAFWHEYVPDAGQSGQGDVMWRKMPHVMIAKVAEALALRKAFPWDPNRGIGIGSDVYTTEEMAQADSPVPVVSVQERVQQRASSAPGVDLRSFAEAVAGMEPEEIRRVRGELFPDATGVSSLSDQQRSVLLARLLEVDGQVTEDATDPGEDGPPLVQQSQAEPEEEIQGEAVEVQEDPEIAALRHAGIQVQDPEGEPEPPGEVRIVACEAPSPFTEGAVCLLPKRHRGAHRSSDSEAWQRD